MMQARRHQNAFKETVDRHPKRTGPFDRQRQALIPCCAYGQSSLMTTPSSIETGNITIATKQWPEYIAIAPLNWTPEYLLYR